MLYSDTLTFLRERKGLTQAKVGALINLDSGTYSHYEKEDLIIPTKHLNTLCNYFEVSFDYILGFSNEKFYFNNIRNIDYKIVGDRLRQFRKENKLTQLKLANLLNTVQPVIVNYENGKHLIALPFLYTICKNYNISADYLLGKTDNPKYLK